MGYFKIKEMINIVAVAVASSMNASDEPVTPYCKCKRRRISTCQKYSQKIFLRDLNLYHKVV